MSTFSKWLYLAGASLCLANPLNAATVNVTYTNDPGTGFFDETARAPVTGNPGITLGEQRRNVYDAVAAYWGQRLDSSVDISITAEFIPQTCTTNSALLGSAGTNSSHKDFPNAPFPGTLYPAALANSLRGIDLDPDTADLNTRDISSEFNSTIDQGNANCLGGYTWEYTLGVQPVNDGMGFYDTVLHEVGHGLGFATFVDNATGEKQNGNDDHYMRRLYDETVMLSWPDMTDAQRQASSINTGNVVFTGPKAVIESPFLTSGLNTGRPRIFTPNPIQSGSSVSHWDSDQFPDEMMEPTATPTFEDWLTLKAFFDFGWKGTPCTRSGLPTDQWIMFALDCIPPDGRAGTGVPAEPVANTVAAILADDIPGTIYDGTNSATAKWAVYEYGLNVGTGLYEYMVLPSTAVMEVGKGYWVKHTNGTTLSLDLPTDSHRTPSPVLAGPGNGCKTGNTCVPSAPLQTPASPAISKVNLVGNPLRQEATLADLRVVTNSGTCVDGCTLAEAETADIVKNLAFTWSKTSTPATGYTKLSTDSSITDAERKLPAGASMWMFTMSSSNGINPRILFPR